MKNNIVKISDLTYDSLSMIFDSRILYDVDEIVIKIPHFTEKQIEDALIRHLQYLLKLQTDEIDGDSESLNNRGKIIDFLMQLPCSDEDGFEEVISYIQDTLMMEQIYIYGLEKLVFFGNKRMNDRYFNPNAKIVVEEIIQ